MWNVYKFNNKDTRTTPLASFWCPYCYFCTCFATCSSVSIVNFKQVNAGWEVIDPCFISIRKFDSFKNPFASIDNLSKLHLTCRRSILLVQTKEVISMSYHSSKIRWNPWRWTRLDLIFRVRINFSELHCERLGEKNLLVLVSRKGPPWLGLKDRIFWNFCML